MKKTKILLITFLLLVACLIFSNKSYALTATTYLEMESDDYNITITSDTPIDTIISALGEPKLTTDSAFGGYAYTFYTDENYDNYLYIETNSSGTICSYASLDSSFTTSGKYSYGDTYNVADSNPGGFIFYSSSNSNKVIGALYYTSVGVSAKSTYISNYESNTTKYLKGISQQGVLMYNALTYFLGGTNELRWDEDMFYINEQYKELRNASIRRYFLDVYDYSKTSTLFKGIFVSTDISIESNSNYLLNPCQFANKAKSTLSTNFGDKNIAIFDYDYNNKTLSAITVSADVFEQTDTVSLTSEETTKLANGRALYESAIANFSLAGDSIYTTEPVTSSASGLVAGVVKDEVQQGTLDYVNAIRVAGGHSELTLKSDNITVGQYKATLLSYRYSELGLQYSLYPWNSGCDGISEEYLELAGKNNTTCIENLYWSSISSTTTSKIMSAVNALLDDTNNSIHNFGHRYNLLYKYKYVGFGISPYIVSNEFSGEASNNEFLVAWPSEGITFMESLTSQKFMWTAKFTDKYDIISGATTVDVECLNTGDTWSFTEEEGSYTSSTTRLYDLVTSSNRIVFYDSEIVPQAGYVYEITINNLEDTSTGNTTSYTYRAAFAYADTDSYGTSVSTLEIDTSKLTQVDGENVYYVAVGEEEKAIAVVDSDATEIKLSWSSSNANVKVTQNGTIIANDITDEDVTITLVSDYTGASTSIKVRPYLPELTTLETETISSKEYLIVRKGQTVSSLLTSTNFPVIDNSYEVTQYNSDNTEKASTDRVCTNDIIQIENSSGTLVQEYYVILKGDVTGNGYARMYDSFLILRGSVLNSSLSDIDVIIRDYNDDGKVRMYDAFLFLRDAVLGR